MKIIIKGSHKEIAALALELQGRQENEIKESKSDEFVNPYKLEDAICKFAECIRNSPVKNGKINKYKYRDMKLSEFANGELFRK